uniref:Uncharacterized protein n=1 Tax=Micromonas pusilla TaxID=38833 RepID=A0A7S0NHV5_MICPS
MDDTARSSAVRTSTRTYGSFPVPASRISAIRASAVISGTDGEENSATMRSISAALRASSGERDIDEVGRPTEANRRVRRPGLGGRAPALERSGAMDRRT